MPDARIAETLWTGATGRALRDHPAEVRELAVLLMTGPGKTLYGLYYKSVRSMAYETGRSEHVTLRGLRVLDDLQFACFDSVNEYVWVLEMAAYQLGPLPLHAGDFKVTNANRWYHGCPKNIFLGAFFDRYADDLRLVGPRRVWVPPEPATGLVAPQKPLVQIVREENCTELVLIPELVDTARFSVAEGFEAFWLAYPRPVGKKDAKKSYVALKPTRELQARILAALEQQKAGNRRWLEDGGRWIPNPATWLNQGRWEDRAVNLPSMSEKTVATLDARQQFIAHGAAQEK